MTTSFENDATISDGATPEQVLKAFKRASTEEGRKGCLDHMNKQVIAAIKALNIGTSTEWIKAYNKAREFGERYPLDTFERVDSDQTADPMDAAAEKVRDNDNKYFPFKPEGFGGCQHTDYVNVASNEAAIEIMHDLLRLDPEKGPGTMLTEAFGGDEEVGDQLQSLLMAAYQRAIVDLATGNIDLLKVVQAAFEQKILNPANINGLSVGPRRDLSGSSRRRGALEEVWGEYKAWRGIK